MTKIILATLGGLLLIITVIALSAFYSPGLSSTEQQVLSLFAMVCGSFGVSFLALAVLAAAPRTSGSHYHG